MGNAEKGTDMQRAIFMWDKVLGFGWRIGGWDWGLGVRKGWDRGLGSMCVFMFEGLFDLKRGQEETELKKRNPQSMFGVCAYLGTYSVVEVEFKAH